MAGFLSRVFRAGRRFVAERRQIAERRRELRDQNCWDSFEAAKRDALAHDHHIGVMTKIRHYYPRKGTKGWMEWIVASEKSEEHTVAAVWVKHMRLQIGSVLVVSGGYAHGDHHHETVFYVESVHNQISRSDYDGWLRQEVQRNRPLGTPPVVTPSASIR